MPDGARPGLLARFRLGSARHPHVLRVRSGGCALSARNLPAPPTAWSTGVKGSSDGLCQRPFQLMVINPT
ncbi:hypothetical protein FJP62_19445 [Pantoea vagans]|uniref:DNA metabolism protein n=1 Tax=Pantoea anthophila TaxID=470931 RepID=A0ABY2Z161_9GAMM|nr:hypothetical protein FJP62_19445 [Pantoea vagans]TPV20901.1 hypothetical protein FJW00_21745 [Pantoea anthophila]